MDITKEQVVDTLRTVSDPALDRDIVTLGYVRAVAACDGFVSVKLTIDDDDDAAQKAIAAAAKAAVKAMGDHVKNVTVELVGGDVQKTEGDAQSAAKPQAAGSNASGAPGGTPLPNVKTIIAVGAGKGGVGKSMVAVNLAVGLARKGLRVGLLDGDIYGPSVPTMLGLQDTQPTGSAQMLDPFETHGIKTMTIGKLVDPEKPLIWRGPMAHGAFRQLTVQTDWGELDYLIIDLPPGTGDVPLTLSQTLPLAGAVIVCTPQQVAQDDAVRAAGMFRSLNVEVLGVVENMSYFVGDDGKEYDLFGRGGAAKMAERIGVGVLGTVPINTNLRKNSDAGDPTANFEGDDALGEELMKMVDAVIAAVEKNEKPGPTLNVT